MLKSLTISNYALIDKLDVDFYNGFSVITGETGAGKSIILGALSLLLGKRADPSVLRDKNVKCIIEGVFSDTDKRLLSFFDDHDLDFDSDTIIRREILPSGKSRAFVNDTPVNLSIISFLGNRFVNIHSQHETLELSDSTFQMNVLDDYCGIADNLAEYKILYEEYKSAEARVNEIIAFNEKARRDEDYLRFQFDELDNADLDKIDYQSLENSVAMLEHGNEIINALGQVSEMLGNGDFAVVDRLNSALKALYEVSAYFKDAEELISRIDSVLIELKDVENEVVILSDKVESDPHALEQFTDRLNLVNTLLKKHNCKNINDLIALRIDYRSKIDNIESADENLVKAQANLKRLDALVKKAALKISKRRKSGAHKFENSALEIIRQLGMNDAGFSVSIVSSEIVTSIGCDKVSFLFNANPGSVAGDISKIASGGELSRLMLAIKSLITQTQVLPTVIFDEIDAGVSGEVAGKVGKVLLQMSQNHQVIAITHLPQIASKAKTHYKVAKFVDNGMTHTKLALLDKQGRVEEVATMISDGTIPETAYKVAQEMIYG